MAESLTLPQRSEYWPLDERDTVLGFPLTFIPQHRAKADISSLVKADIFILGRHYPIISCPPDYLDASLQPPRLRAYGHPEKVRCRGCSRARAVVIKVITGCAARVAVK